MTGGPRRAGIIAAGDGTRLRASHPGLPKPLVPVAGAPLCHWVVRSLLGAGVREIVLLHNSRGRAVRESLAAAFPSVSWRFLEADTASSFESFRLVSRSAAAEAEDFLMTTVDALIPPSETARFALAARSAGAAAALALTGFVDDEKPLWADLDPSGRVRALGPAARQRAHVTAGLYYLTRPLALGMPEAAAHGSLRAYLTSLIESGVPVTGLPLSKTLDVDRPEDLSQAEGFLQTVGAEEPTW